MGRNPNIAQGDQNNFPQSRLTILIRNYKSCKKYTRRKKKTIVKIIMINEQIGEEILD